MGPVIFLKYLFVCVVKVWSLIMEQNSQIWSLLRVWGKDIRPSKKNKRIKYCKNKKNTLWYWKEVFHECFYIPKVVEFNFINREYETRIQIKVFDLPHLSQYREEKYTNFDALWIFDAELIELQKSLILRLIYSQQFFFQTNFFV